jgi:hypothetical protein
VAILSQDIITRIKAKRMRWAGHVVYMGKIINEHKMLVEKPEGTIPDARPRRRWLDNIKTYIRKI